MIDASSAPPASTDAPDAPDWVGVHVRQGERVLWWARPSLVGLVPRLMAALLAIVPIVVFGVTYPAFGPARDVIAAIIPGFLLAGIALGVPVVRDFVRLRFTVYLVTDQRFVSVNSFLTTTVESLPLSRISVVSFRQGILTRFFGLWTARVSSYGRAGKILEIPAIPDGERLLSEVGAGLGRGANASWLLRGD